MQFQQLFYIQTNFEKYQRNKELQRLFSIFPGGIPGLGLLLLRLTLGIATLVQGTFYLVERENQAIGVWLFVLLAFLCGTSLLLGFLTPVSGSIVTVGCILSTFSLTPLPSLNVSLAIYLITISAAVVMLGPGAFSLDARMYGRREIIIPDNRREPRF